MRGRVKLGGMSTQTITTPGGVRIAYHEFGSGDPAIIFIYGGFGNRTGFGFQEECFSSNGLRNSLRAGTVATAQADRQVATQVGFRLLDHRSHRQHLLAVRRRYHRSLPGLRLRQRQQQDLEEQVNGRSHSRGR